VTPFNGGESATNEEFFNKRAESYWQAREALREGRITLEPQGDTDGFKYQLTASKYSYDAKGRIKIERKEDMKKRGVKSPDRADAFVMGFAPQYAPLWRM